jgi:hypothetical protein
MSNLLYGLDKAAALLGGISVWTLRKHVFRGNVAVTRIGRRVFLCSEEIERIRREGVPSLSAAVRGAGASKAD